ncbi:MAG: hypothetical protein ACYC3I_01965 [Gemmataceae bacterium]
MSDIARWHAVRGVCLAPRSAFLFSLILPLALCAIGCNRTKSYVPSASDGRKALEAALTAWQNGQKVGTIENAEPPVQAVDSGWGKGRKLANYEILNEMAREDGRRSFKVRLNLQNPPETQEVQYLVVGRSPLWVFREEDYNGFQNWGDK